MTIIEEYELFDKIIQFIHKLPNHRGTINDIDVRGRLYQILTAKMETAVVNDFRNNYSHALSYLKNGGYLEKRGDYYTLTSEGEKKRLHGFVKTYTEDEADKKLKRKSLEVSIELTEQQILDIGKAKRRSRAAIIISIIALLVTSSFEGYKIYVENKNAKNEDPNKDKDQPTENNAITPEIKHKSDTIEKFSHDSAEIKKPIK